MTPQPELVIHVRAITMLLGEAAKRGLPAIVYSEFPRGEETPEDMVFVLSQIGFSGCVAMPHPEFPEKWQVMVPVKKKVA
jgi:hypothetical protein